LSSPVPDKSRLAELNRNLQLRSLRHVWHPCTQMQRALKSPPLPVARAKGPWLYDMEGRRYFDAISSWWVNLFGHGDERINQAIEHQLHTLPHVMLAGCTHAPAVELAEKLSARTQGVLGHAFYASDGASAVEISLKMSFHHWRNVGRSQKREFICLRQGYHGETLGALAVTDVTVFRDAYDPLLMHSHQVMSPDARQAQAGETATDVAQRALSRLRALLQARHASLAALIIEPLVQCAAGMALHDPLYLRGVRQLCDEFEVHLIADEIAVGFGRTGTFFAFEQAATDPAVWPDFICLSKGITGGYLPLSVVLSRDAIFQAFLDDDIARGFLHSHSYTGNALACAAALAVLQRFEDEPVLADNAHQASILTQALSPLQFDDRLVHARHLGMIWAWDIKPEYAGQHFAERFHQVAKEHELLLRPIGRTLYLMPPYVLTEETSHWLAKQLKATLDQVLQEPTLTTTQALKVEPSTA
jgi:adenosylmethionine---8-amino-7-oxononanoate aminotransferase